MKSDWLNNTAIVLLIIGGLNWLLVGIFGWDIGQIFGGQAAIISRLIYIIVGLSAIVLAFTYWGSESSVRRARTS